MQFSWLELPKLFDDLATQGAGFVLTSQQAVDMARAAPSSQLASDLLVREAIACGSQDNVTVLVVRL